MTMTDVAPVSTRAQESIPPRPSLNQVITAVTSESGYSRLHAVALISRLTAILRDMRACDYDVYHLTAWEIEDIHDVLDAVMPDDTAPAPGSAHDLINRHLLRDDEVSFTHSKAGGIVRDCTVTVELISL